MSTERQANGKNERKLNYAFAAIPDWVIEHPDLDGNAIRVYALMGRFTKAFPSLTYAAEKCGCSEQTIRRAVRSLQAVGAVRVTPRFDSAGRQTTNSYELAGDHPLTGALSNMEATPLSPVVGEVDQERERQKAFDGGITHEPLIPADNDGLPIGANQPTDAGRAELARIKARHHRQETEPCGQ